VSQLPVRIDTGMLSLQPLEQLATGPLRLGVEPLPKERPISTPPTEVAMRLPCWVVSNSGTA